MAIASVLFWVILSGFSGFVTTLHMPTESLVHDVIDWPSFLGKHDMKFTFERQAQSDEWEYLPTSWLHGPFSGNGLVGQVMYFCDPPTGNGAASRGGLCWKGNYSRHAEMRIELGRQDLYSSRKPTNNFWSGVRLPVGYVRVVTKGQLLGGQLQLSLWNAEIVGTLTTSMGNVSIRLFTHADLPITVLEHNCTDGEEVTMTFEPTTKCVDRWDVAGLVPCEMRPNPPAQCSHISDRNTTTTVCRQHLKEDEGELGSYSAAVATTDLGDGRGVTFMTVASALWPYSTSVDPRVEAQDTLAHAHSNKASLRSSHQLWWHQFWPRSFLSIPVTRVEGFYWIEMYKIASSSREDGPMKDEIGPWYVDTEWPGYWYDLNSELTYWPIGASNRVELGRNLGKQLKLNVDNGNLADNVLSVQPTWNGSMSIGASSNQQHVGGQAGCLVWITSNLWALCDYEYNATCHTEYLLPVLRGAVGVFDHVLTFTRNNILTDQLHMPVSDLPNCGGGGWDNSFDIGGAHWGLKTYVSLCDAVVNSLPPFDRSHHDNGVGQDTFNLTLATQSCLFRDRAAWLLERLVPLQISETGINAAWKVPFVEPCRHFDHLLPCMPWQMYPSWDKNSTLHGEVCSRTVDQFYNITWSGSADCTFSYPPVSQMSAALGRGDAAWGNITAVTDWVTAIMPNTMDNEGDPVPSARQIINIDPCATAALADSIQYMMLQSHNNRIQIFPAAGKAWDDGAIFYQLRAMRAFLVSARATAGRVEWAQIESIAGAQPVVVATTFTIDITHVSQLVVETLPRAANISLTIETVSPLVIHVHGLLAGGTVLIYPKASGDDVTLSPPPVVKPIPYNSSELHYWGYHPQSPRSRAFNVCCGR